MKRIHLLVRGLMAVLIAAFVMRPVVVDVHNGSLLSGTQPNSQRLSTSSLAGPLAPAKAAFHNVAKEFKDLTTPSPCFTRGRAPAVGNAFLNLTAASCRHLPPSLLVLRI